MNLEDFIKYYFPNVNIDEVSERLKQISNEPVRPWGRGIYDEAARYESSLISTAIALMEGKAVLAISKYGDKIVNDMKNRFNLDVVCQQEKNSCVLKLR